MMTRLVDQLALQALTDDEAIPVLGDAVLLAEWFDPRVMQVVWPLGRAKRNGERTPATKLRRRLDREAWKAGYREYFFAFAAKPTGLWARAIAAVVLFGTWQKRPWAVVQRSGFITYYTNLEVRVNGQPLSGLSDLARADVRIGVPPKSR